MAENKKLPKHFDPEQSKMASYLSNLTDKQLFERYFTKDNGVSWKEDFEDLLNSFTNENKEEYVYSLAVSLQGKALNDFVSVINLYVPQKLVPKGYKLNSKALLEDYEKILAENPKRTHEASIKSRTENKATLYVTQIDDFFGDIISGRSLDYEVNNFGDDLNV